MRAFMLDSWLSLSKTLDRLTSFVDRVSVLRLSAGQLVQSLLDFSSGIRVSASLGRNDYWSPFFDVRDF